MATEKQKLAKARNYFKYVIAGLYKSVQLDKLTPKEVELWDKICRAREELLDMFDEESRAKGLNVPEHKCFCGRKAKIQKMYYGKLMWVCPIHLMEK